jgi:hypothetical protein
MRKNKKRGDNMNWTQVPPHLKLILIGAVLTSATLIGLGICLASMGFDGNTEVSFLGCLVKTEHMALGAIFLGGLLAGTVIGRLRDLASSGNASPNPP